MRSARPGPGSPQNILTYTLPEPPSDTDAAFRPLLEGNVLRDWDGDPAYWRLRDRCIVGETTGASVLSDNTWMIWRGGKLRDFELKLEYRISAAGKSGVYYRTKESSERKWLVSGYQAVIDGSKWFAEILVHAGATLSSNTKRDLERSLPGWIKANYADEEIFGRPGRQILALPGQLSILPQSRLPQVAGYLDSGSGIGEIPNKGWNTLHIIARNNILIHVLNHRVVSVVIDDDAKARRLSGGLALQLHSGPPMKVEFRGLRLKRIGVPNRQRAVA